MKTNKTITITRLTQDATNPNIKSWQSVGTATVMLIPLSDEQRQLARADGIIGQSYNVYAPLSVDIRGSDRIVIDGEGYDVRGVKKYEGTSNVDHLEVLVEKIKE